MPPMLPDKNELNDELIEQISGGGSYPQLLDPLQGVNPTQKEEIKQARALPSTGTTEGSCASLDSGKQYLGIEQRTALVGGDLKTTVPNVSDKDKLVKIH